MKDRKEDALHLRMLCTSTNKFVILLRFDYLNGNDFVLLQFICNFVSVAFICIESMRPICRIKLRMHFVLCACVSVCCVCMWFYACVCVFVCVVCIGDCKFKCSLLSK